MSPLWLLVFLAWYHLSSGSETEDFKANSKTKSTIILQPSDVSQRQLDYEVIPIENLSSPSPKYEHFFSPSDNEDDDIMIYSISYSNESPSADYPYSQLVNENNRVKRSSNRILYAKNNKIKRSTENTLRLEDSYKQSKHLPRSNIYNLLLQAENLDRMSPGQFSSNMHNQQMKIDDAYKRNAKFHSWGGKRTSFDDASVLPSPYIDVDPAVFYENMKSPYDTNERKRARFNSWGGKRKEEENTGPKTLPFRPWGGKRDKPDILVWPKYTPFKAWGGKRSESVGFYPPDDQSMNTPSKKDHPNRRPRFYSWGGKRNDFSSIPQSTTPQQEKNADNPLNLRQADDGSDLRMLFHPGNAWKNFDRADKRSKFNAWGGKRSPEIANYPVYKKSFNSWGGKRATSTSTEPDITENDEISLVSFDI